MALAFAYLLAFNLLQQLPATTHAPTPLPYLFLVVLDGFIAFALYTAVRLHADENTASTAWVLAFIAVVTRGVTVLVLGHLGTRQSPGAVWQPDDVAVTWMSALAPLVLAFAGCLYAMAASDRNTPSHGS
ncbi:hypothetical protein ACIO3O_08310 [Streptomyces sp. NPDC087440]|uniref:hypothetical protein n=1 Tax=Streptomyces sp. NPDC087440 TaxID=3365790 RepID=UPI0037F88E7A